MVVALRSTLKGTAHRVIHSTSVSNAVGSIRRLVADIVILDLNDNESSVETVLSAMRHFAGVRVISLGAEQSSNRQLLLNLGVECFLKKPVPLSELVAQIEKMSSKRNGASDESIEHFNIKLMTNEQKAFDGSSPINLSKSQFAILKTMISDPGRVFRRDELVLDAIGDQHTGRTVDVHVHAIRKALGSRGELIETVRGVGYRFRDV